MEREEAKVQAWQNVLLNFGLWAQWMVLYKKNEIEPFRQGTTCKFQKYIEKVDKKHSSKRNCSKVHSFGHPLYV